MSMKVVVLGSSASMPAAGDACSGYLVQCGDTNVLLDCGTGVISALQKHIALTDLTAIVITHFHPDHFIDLVPLRYGLRYGPGESIRPRVFLPPHGIAYLNQVGMGLRNSENYFEQAYDLEEYEPEGTLTFGDLNLSFCRTTHDIPTWAISVTDGEHTFAYTADTQESAELVEFFSGADVLLSESTYPSTLANLPSGNHLTSKQACELATHAGVGHLVLSHFWPGIDRQEFLADAATTFQGPISLAESGSAIAVNAQNRSKNAFD